jgi:hypothetical protein
MSPRTKREREELRARWVASGAPEVQERLRAALQAVGVDLDDYTAQVGLDNNGRFFANLRLGHDDLDAVIEALEAARG